MRQNHAMSETVNEPELVNRSVVFDARVDRAIGEFATVLGLSTNRLVVGALKTHMERAGYSFPDTMLDNPSLDLDMPRASGVVIQ